MHLMAVVGSVQPKVAPAPDLKRVLEAWIYNAPYVRNTVWKQHQSLLQD